MVLFLEQSLIKTQTNEQSIMWGRFHPFSQLVAGELAEAAAMVREEYSPDDEIVFKSINLLEPDKDAALEYLDAEHAAEDQRRGVDRCACLSFYRKHSVRK